MSYPDEFLRGISNPNDITSEGYATQAIFRFDDYDPNRTDGYRELSINWVDDDGALPALLNQVSSRTGNLQFKGGYCSLKLSSLIANMKIYLDNGHFSYERKPIIGDPANNIVENKYHGNLLVKSTLTKQVVTNIQAMLACYAGLAIKR